MARRINTLEISTYLAQTYHTFVDVICARMTVARVPVLLPPNRILMIDLSFAAVNVSHIYYRVSDN